MQINSKNIKSGILDRFFKDFVLPLLFTAIYIDIDEDDIDKDDGSKEYSRWADLPDLLLENIFSYLSMREKYYASLVCKSWYRAFHLPYVWSQFVLEDSTLTRGRFNYYSGWQVR